VDVQERDHDGALLAYVHGPTGTFVNGELVFLGHAETVITPPNTKQRLYLLALQKTARAAKRGVWGLPDAHTYVAREDDSTPVVAYGGVSVQLGPRWLLWAMETPSGEAPTGIWRVVPAVFPGGSSSYATGEACRAALLVIYAAFTKQPDTTRAPDGTWRMPTVRGSYHGQFDCLPITMNPNEPSAPRQMNPKMEGAGSGTKNRQ
jgi:hypothetical protein